MTSSPVGLRPFDNAAVAFFEALDEANVTMERGELQAATLCFERARELAGHDRQNQLLVDAGLLCLWAEHKRHREVLALIDRCLREYEDLLREPENDSFQVDIVMQKALSLIELHRWTSALDVLRSPELPQEAPEVQFHIGRCMQALCQFHIAEQYFLGAQRGGLPEELAGVFHYQLGKIYYESKRFAAAERELSTCAALGDVSRLPGDFGVMLREAGHQLRLQGDGIA